MTIGEAARRSGVSAKMIRWYEARGLLPPAERSECRLPPLRGGGCPHAPLRPPRPRPWMDRGRHRRPLALWRDRSRRSAEVKALATGHIAALRRRIAELEGMVDTLSHLAESCQGNARPECPILADLAGVAAPT